MQKAEIQPSAKRKIAAVDNKHDCIGCPYATPSDKKRHVTAFEGRLDVDMEMNRITVDGSTYSLRRAWIKVLASLATRPGRVLSSDHLILAIYGDGEEPEDPDSALKICISSIKKYLKGKGIPLVISNIWSAGYTVELKGDAPQAPPPSADNLLSALYGGGGLSDPAAAASRPILKPRATVTESQHIEKSQKRQPAREKPVKWWKGRKG